MQEILLTRGFVTIVDDEDFEYLNSFKWHYAHGYAVRNIPHPVKPGKCLKIGMHRFLMELDFGDPRDVDHRNEMKLDNRRTNLRVCTQSENARNRGAIVKNRAGLKGVYWEKKSRRWRAQIGSKGAKSSR